MTLQPSTPSGSSRSRPPTGYSVYELPPNTQEFTALQILNLMEGYDVAAWGDGTADYYHHMAEAVKVAFADREEWLTDPNFVDIPVQRLIAKAYADERRRLIDPERAQNIAEVPAGIPYAHPHARRVPKVTPVTSAPPTGTGWSSP